MNPSARRDLWAAVAVIALAFLLRALAFAHVPPGPVHDEVWDWINIQSGPRLYYAVGGGREGAFIWLEALSAALMGANLFALRLPAVMAGTLGAAAVYAFGRRAFGRHDAALASALAVAISFWGVFYSRIAQRPILLPLTLTLSFYALWRAVMKPSHKASILAGTLLGTNVYVYTPGWAAAAVAAAWIGVLALMGKLRARRGLILIAGAFALTVLPALIAPRFEPEAFARVEVLGGPVGAALSGDFGPLLRNAGPVLGAFMFAGDDVAMFNLPGRPIFPDFGFGLLFACGFGLAAWHAVFRRGKRAGAAGALLVLWWAGMVAPTMLTGKMPVNTYRTIGALPPTFLMIGWAAAAIWRFARVQTLTYSLRLLLVAAFALDLGVMVIDYGRWAALPEVRFLYQEDFAHMAREIEGSEGAVSIGGVTPDRIDPASMAILLRDPGSMDLRFFDARDSLVIPGGAGRVSVITPAFQPLPEVLRFGEVVRETDNFSLREVAPADIIPQGEPIATFDGSGRAELLAVEKWAGGIVTVWRALAPSPVEVRIFVHALDAEGVILTQHDGLGVPEWVPGDVFWQMHTLEIPAGAALRIGLYDPAGGDRWVTGDGAEFIILR